MTFGKKTFYEKYILKNILQEINGALMTTMKDKCDKWCNSVIFGKENRQVV